jgi:hypothetical protein
MLTTLVSIHAWTHAGPRSASSEPTFASFCAGIQPTGPAGAGEAASSIPRRQDRSSERLGRHGAVPRVSHRTVELHRAARFPDVRVREAVPVENVATVDATLVTHAGRRWLFAGLVDGGLEPGQPRPVSRADPRRSVGTASANPVAIDVRAGRAARVAGRRSTYVERSGRPRSDRLRRLPQAVLGAARRASLAPPARRKSRPASARPSARIRPAPRAPACRPRRRCAGTARSPPASRSPSTDCRRA